LHTPASLNFHHHPPKTPRMNPPIPKHLQIPPAPAARHGTPHGAEEVEFYDI
jgi:hypothetical protein